MNKPIKPLCKPGTTIIKNSKSENDLKNQRGDDKKSIENHSNNNIVFF